jgi:hypothetical protein
MRAIFAFTTILISLSSFASTQFESSAVCMSADETKKFEIQLTVSDETVMVHEGAFVQIKLPSGDVAKGMIKSLSNGPKATNFEIMSVPSGSFTLKGNETADGSTYVLSEGETKTSLKCSNSPLIILSY